MLENDELDYYQSPKPKQNEPQPEQITNIGGNEFKNGHRLTISGLLFEVVSHNRIYYCGDDESLTTGLKTIKNTVFDISGENYWKFFAFTGLNENEIKKCIFVEQKPINARAFFDEISKIDFTG